MAALSAECMLDLMQIYCYHIPQTVKELSTPLPSSCPGQNLIHTIIRFFANVLLMEDSTKYFNSSLSEVTLFCPVTGTLKKSPT